MALLLVIAYLYRGVVPRLVLNWWDDPNFSHGFFIPAFSAFVVWTRWQSLKQVALRPSNWGVVLIAGSALLLAAGQLGAELFLSRVSLIFLLAGVVIYYLGWPMFRALFFPWAILFLMVPIPAIIFNEITFPLQFLASKVASAALPWLGVPVLRQGNVLQLSTMSLEVADACSGIRSLMSLEALTIIYGYVLERRIWIRIVLAISALPIAVFANALRIVSTGACVQYWDPERAEGFFHAFSGWAIFIIAVLLLLAVHKAILLLVPRGEEHAA